jgi:hypothetical protein
MATGFLALCFGAGLLVPKALGCSAPPPLPPGERVAVAEAASL